MPLLLDGSLTEEYDRIVDSNTGLGQLFLQQAQNSPHANAVIDGQYVLTYAELHLKALGLAIRLREKEGFQSAERTAILVAPGINDIIAQVAVLYAGGTCVPLDPSLPDQQAESRLDDVGAQYLIVDAKNEHRLAISQRVCIDDERLKYGDITHFEGLPVLTTLSHRTHLLFTSGTSDKPKAVQILARSILQVVYHASFGPLNASDRVAHTNNTSFDASLFDIWIPLLRGAGIVIIPKSVLLNPFALAESIEHYKLTAMIALSAVFNLTAAACPSAFLGMKRLIIGGEAANIKAIRTVLKSGPPRQLVNAYGPTETCIFSLAHVVTLEDVRMGSVSIGKPIGNTFVHILDDSLLPVKDEQVGELFIGGAGVSPGYVNRASKNASSFVDLAGLSETGMPVRLYRTGDLVKRRKSGLIDYIGRQDNQVKIRGYRIELEAVETALLKTGCFSAVVALKIDSPREGAGSMLVAFAIPVLSEKRGQDDATEILKTLLPDYMVPRIQLIDKFPLNSHNKVDRRKLKDLILEQWHPRSHLINSGSMDTTSRLEQTWLDILAIPNLRIDSEEDFLLLGGTSLQAAVLLHQIRQEFGTEISSSALYENSTLSALSDLINANKDSKVPVKDEKNHLLADSRLAEGLALPTGRLPQEWRADTEGRVLLTGATGFVGAHFLAQLLETPGVHQVGCLVRASNSVSGLLRIQKSLQKYQLWEELMASKLLVLPGILEDETLGLGQERFDQIADWASVVFHLGAHVNYTQPYSIHRPANVLGTLNVLRLAIHRRPKALHYVSSISAFGPTGWITGASHISEDESLIPHLEALSYDHGYAQSQWVVDQMLQNTIDRGFPVAIYRPGFITGSSTTGFNNPDDFLSRFMSACLQMGSYPLLPHQRKEFVPLDYVNSALLLISSSNKNLGRAYHLVPQDRSQSVDMLQTFDLVKRLGFPNLQGLPYSEWVRRLLKDSPERLKPLVPMLEEKVYKDLTRWELYQNMPIYGRENTNRALANAPHLLEPPAFDEKLMKLYLRDWI